MTRGSTRLGTRTGAVFRQFFGERADSLHPEDRAAAARFWEELGRLDPPAAEPVRTRRAPGWIAAATAAALILFAVPVGLLTMVERSPGGAAYASGQGEIRSLALSDGSQVQLGAQSRIELHFSRDERRIQLLAGEAIFEVSSDPERPFIVETTAGEVRALGTAFMVRLGHGAARLVVIEGTVRVVPRVPEKGADRVSRVADAGEEVSFGAKPADSSGTSQAFVTAEGPADVARSTAWTRGMLYFNGEPLGEVIAVVNRYAERPVALGDDRFADTPVYAAIRVGDTSAVEAIIANP